MISTLKTLSLALAMALTLAGCSSEQVAQDETQDRMATEQFATTAEYTEPVGEPLTTAVAVEEELEDGQQMAYDSYTEVTEIDVEPEEGSATEDDSEDEEDEDSEDGEEEGSDEDSSENHEDPESEQDNL